MYLYIYMSEYNLEKNTFLLIFEFKDDFLKFSLNISYNNHQLMPNVPKLKCGTCGLKPLWVKV